MPLGAIVKSVGSSIAKDKAKKVATDKLMGRKKGKGGASKGNCREPSGGISGSTERSEIGRKLMEGEVFQIKTTNTCRGASRNRCKRN